MTLSRSRKEHLLGLMETAMAGEGVLVRCASRSAATNLRWTFYRLRHWLGPDAQGLSFSLLPSPGQTCDLAITWSPPGDGIVEVEPLAGREERQP